MPKKRTLSEAEAAALFGDDLLKKARARWEKKVAPARAQWDGSRPPAPEPPTPTAPLYVARAGTLSPSEPKANQRTDAGTLGGDVSPADAFWWEML